MTQPPKSNDSKALDLLYEENAYCSIQRYKATNPQEYAFWDERLAKARQSIQEMEMEQWNL